MTWGASYSWTWFLPQGKRIKDGNAPGAIVRALRGLSVEVAPTASSRVGLDLSRIEAEIASGARDLKVLGFWRVVSTVKADPGLIDAFADRIAAVDQQAFRAGVKLRVPVWVGNLIMIVGILLGAGAVAFALRSSTSSIGSGLALILAAGIWAVSLHCPAHWLVGRITKIRFTDYSLGGPPPPRPGLKIDYGSYLRADPKSRAWMHASGALATKAAPFIALAFWPASGAAWWSAAVLIALGILQITTDVLFSVRSGDWKKFRREMALARRGPSS
jgi:hypothetical protein